MSLEQAWSEWNGFVTLAPGERSRSPRVRLTSSSSIEPLSFARDHATTGWVDAIGVQFLRGVTFAGMLYPFLGGALIDDGSHLSRVSADWLGKFPQHRPGGILNRPPVTISEPVFAVVGPGHQTYGHWIIDFLPRIAIAREILGKQFDSLRFLILLDTPAWAKALMEDLFGIRETQLLYFEFAVDEFICEKVCYPTYAHSYPFFLHSFVQRYYHSISKGVYGKRKLCIQRRSNNSGRHFTRQDYFEQIAQSHGFELVDPQRLAIDEQAALFRSAAVVIGEYGSALHNSVFCSETTLFGVLNAPGVEQSRLCAAFGQQIMFAIGESNEQSWTLSDRQMADFFTTLHRLTLGKEASMYSCSPSLLDNISDSTEVRPFSTLSALIEGCDWSLRRGPADAAAEVIQLRGDRHITGAPDLQHATWDFFDDELVFLKSSGNVVLRFSRRLDIGDGVLLAGDINSSEVSLETLPSDPRRACRSGARRLEPANGSASAAYLIVGDHTLGSDNIATTAGSRLVIGKFCVLDARISIVPALDSPPVITAYDFGSVIPSSLEAASSVTTETVIGNDVRIEVGVMIRAGVRIGDGARVLAGSVLTRDVAPYSIVEGNPACHVGCRFSKAQIRELLILRWWDWPIGRIQELLHLMMARDPDRFLAAAEQYRPGKPIA